MAVGETGGLGWGGVASVAAVGVRHFLAFYSLVSSSGNWLTDLGNTHGFDLSSVGSGSLDSGQNSPAIEV